MLSKTPESVALCQDRLNIRGRSRTSRLPWRGQFSPELIEYLIEKTCPDANTFLDPFCGSGTVLFEAIRAGKAAYGAEVNPAAWHLAELASFAELTGPEKAEILKQFRRLINESASAGTLLEEAKPNLIDILNAQDTHPIFRMAVAASIVLGMGNGAALTYEGFTRGAFGVLEVLLELEKLDASARCFLDDARSLPLSDGAVDAIITSPPYINVFNYHQNYRPAVELMGWQPLQAASSEIGANRKHRQNRFLTVVQYSLDMSAFLAEASRLLASDGRFVIVLGRTSDVLGASFRNGDIIGGLMEASGGFENIQREERVFCNRFGAQIYEDIFVARKRKTIASDLGAARQIGLEALQSARAGVPEKNREALEGAIQNAARVEPSPLLGLDVPQPFAARTPQRKTIENGSRSRRRARG